MSKRVLITGGAGFFGTNLVDRLLEHGYAKSLLERGGHEVLIVDGQVEDLSRQEITARVAAFHPDFTVVTTAPSYLFWRCAPPELRIPQEMVGDLCNRGGISVAVGPHGSTTPQTTLRKLAVDVVVLGEAEEILPQFAGKRRDAWHEIPSVCYLRAGELCIQGKPHASNMAALPALEWPTSLIWRHHHHHHRFDVPPWGPGTELEASRGCPYHCSFCAKENFRNGYRKRPLPVILAELDGLLVQGVEYVYFINEIFLPDAELLEALAVRDVLFGVQTRIDLWRPAMLDLLGRAGCVSLEAGVESISSEGRDLVDKSCKLSTDELSERLIDAKKSIPFVQANLLDATMDDPLAVEAWRRYLQRYGVWANAPVPLFPYPGSPHYTKRWGLPDEHAWCVRYGAVRQLGHLGASALGHWLGRAAIYVLPARYEPFGLSILEAGLAGCALVVGDIPSLRENWDGAAVFVPPDDAEALAMELSRLIQKPERLGILADRAHTRAREFTPQRMCAGYLAAYQQLLRARQRQGLREKTGLTFS